MIRTWKIDPNQCVELEFPSATSLDLITQQLGNGYYSTFRTYGGGQRVMGLARHLDRLPGVDTLLFRRTLNQLSRHFIPEEVRVRIVLTFSNELYVSIEPLILPPKKYYSNGIKTKTTSIQRHDPRVKGTSFIRESRDERAKLVSQGIYELLLTKNDRILEGMTSNFYYVMRGTLHTAKRNILFGVTRNTVLYLAKRVKIPVRYTSLSTSQIGTINEAFITSSSRGVLPIVKINESKVGRGKPGPLTRRLMKDYNTYVESKSEPIWTSKE